MPLFEAGDIKVEIDDKGYLAEGQAWSPELAAALAEADGLGGLTADHWKVIHYLREFHGAKGSAPMIRVLCRETGFSLQRIYDLFPEGPARGACRIAGLPRPDSCT